MSAPEQQREEPRSSVKFSLNAKREGQLETKHYLGDDPALFDQLRLNAQEQFLASVSWLRENGLCGPVTK